MSGNGNNSVDIDEIERDIDVARSYLKESSIRGSVEGTTGSIGDEMLTTATATAPATAIATADSGIGSGTGTGTGTRPATASVAEQVSLLVVMLLM